MQNNFKKLIAILLSFVMCFSTVLENVKSIYATEQTDANVTDEVTTDINIPDEVAITQEDDSQTSLSDNGEVVDSDFNENQERIDVDEESNVDGKVLFIDSLDNPNETINIDNTNETISPSNEAMFDATSSDDFFYVYYWDKYNYNLSYRYHPEDWSGGQNAIDAFYIGYIGPNYGYESWGFTESGGFTYSGKQTDINAKIEGTYYVGTSTHMYKCEVRNGRIYIFENYLEIIREKNKYVGRVESKQRDKYPDNGYDSATYFWYVFTKYGVSNKVTFNSNNSSNNVWIQYTDAFYGSILLPDCSSNDEKYIFYGWNTEKDGSGTRYDGFRYSDISEPLTLYAQWKPVEDLMTVTYYDNGGISEMGEKGEIGFYKGDNVQILSSGLYWRNGFTFVGFNTKADGTGIDYVPGESYVLNEPLTLYAQWKPDSGKISICFDASGGDGAPISAEFPKFANVKLIGNIFTKKDHVFVGWNTKPDGTGKDYVADQSYTFDSDITLYAKWKPDDKTLTIEYNSNDGSGMVKTDKVTKGAPQETIPNSFAGIKDTMFYGWNTKPDGTGVTYFAPKAYFFYEDKVLYAIWKPNPKGVIRYKSNGGTGSMTEQAYHPNSMVQIAQNTFKKEGYTFVGWNTSSFGTGDTYMPDKYYTLSNNSYSLSAVWKSNLLTIKGNRYDKGIVPLSKDDIKLKAEFSKMDISDNTINLNFNFNVSSSSGGNRYLTFESKGTIYKNPSELFKGEELAAVQLEDTSKFKFLSMTIEKKAIENILLPINYEALKDKPIIKISIMEKSTGEIFYFEDAFENEELLNKVFENAVDTNGVSDELKDKLKFNTLWFFGFLVPTIDGEIEGEPVKIFDNPKAKAKGVGVDEIIPTKTGPVLYQEWMGKHALEKNERGEDRLNKVVGSPFYNEYYEALGEYRFITYKYPSAYVYDSLYNENSGILATEYFVWKYQPFIKSDDYVEDKVYGLGDNIPVESSISIWGSGLNLYNTKTEKHEVFKTSSYGDTTEFPNYISPHGFQLKNVAIRNIPRQGEILYKASSYYLGRKSVENKTDVVGMVYNFYQPISYFIPIPGINFTVSALLGSVPFFVENFDNSSVVEVSKGQPRDTIVYGSSIAEHKASNNDKVVKTLLDTTLKGISLAKVGDHLTNMAVFTNPKDFYKEYKEYIDEKPSKVSLNFSHLEVIYSFELYYYPYAKISESLSNGTGVLDHIYYDDKYKLTKLRGYNREDELVLRCKTYEPAIFSKSYKRDLKK